VNKQAVTAVAVMATAVAVASVAVASVASVTVAALLPVSAPADLCGGVSHGFLWRQPRPPIVKM